MRESTDSYNSEREHHGFNVETNIDIPIQQFDDSPTNYSEIIQAEEYTECGNENTPLLQDSDPPPDYTDFGNMDEEELPSYQQVQREGQY